MKLSIVVPCHNECENLPFLFERFLAVAEKRSVEVIMVNNASSDNSSEVFQSLLHDPKYSFVRMVEEPTPGYGKAIISGLKAATGDVLAWTHADMQTDPMDVIRALEIFEGFPNGEKIIVKGKRVNRPIGAWAFTLGMSVIATTILRGLYFDVNAQPKMFTRSFFIEFMTTPPNDFSLDLYLMAIAKKQGYKIETFPVYFSKRLYGESAWAFSFKSRWKTTLRTIKYILSLNHLLRRTKS